MQQYPVQSAANSPRKPIITVATSLSEIAPLVSEWDSLVQRSDDLDLFVSPAWMTLWYETFLSGQEKPALVCVTDTEGRLAGVLPLVTGRRYFGPVPYLIYESASGDAIACGDHLGLVASPDNFTWVYREVWDWLLARAADGALVRLLALDEATPFAISLQRDIKEHAARWRQVMSTLAPRLPLPSSYEAYERLLSRKRRQWIRHNWRILERDHNAMVCCNDEVAPLDTVLEEWLVLHDQLWATRRQNTTLENRRFREFIRRFCYEAARCGWLRLHQLRVKERLVAGMIVFHWKDRAYCYQSARHPDFAAYDVGELMFIHCIHTAINEGMSVFDFLRGEERYKFRLRAQPHTLLGFEFACSYPGQCLVWAGNVRGELGQIVRRLKGTANAKPNASDGQPVKTRCQTDTC